MTVSGVEDKNGNTIDGESVIFKGLVRLKISELNFYKDYGTGSSVQITDGVILPGNISAVAENMLINSQTPKHMMVVTTLYKDGSLVDIMFGQGYVSVDSLSPMVANISVPETLTDGEYVLKAFVIESFSNSVPLSNTISQLQ